MDKNIAFKDIWHSAGIGGLVLAVVSTAFMLLNMKLISLQEGWVLYVKLAAGCIKIAACAYLMWYFLCRFKSEFTKATKDDIRREGGWIAFLSALIFSATYMAWFIWHPQDVTAIIEGLRTAYGEHLNANSTTVLDTLQNHFPRMAFLSQLLYCFVYGWIIAAIMAPQIATEKYKKRKKNTDEQ